MTSGSGFFDAIMGMAAEGADAKADTTSGPIIEPKQDAPRKETPKPEMVRAPKPAVALPDFPVVSQDEATRLFRVSCEVSRRVNMPAPEEDNDGEFFARRGFTFSIDDPSTHARLKRGERHVRPTPADPDANLTASQRMRRQIDERARARAAAAAQTVEQRQAEAPSSTPEAETAQAPGASKDQDEHPVALSDVPLAPAAEEVVLPEPEVQQIPEVAAQELEAEAPAPEAPVSEPDAIVENEVLEVEATDTTEEVAADEIVELEDEVAETVIELAADEIAEEAAATEVEEIEEVVEEPQAAAPIEAEQPTPTPAPKPAPLEWVPHEVSAVLEEAPAAEIAEPEAAAAEHQPDAVETGEAEVAEEVETQPEFEEVPLIAETAKPVANNVVSTPLNDAFAPTAKTAKSLPEDEVKEPGAWDLYEQKLRRL